MINKIVHLIKKENGQSLVEMALVLPILLLLIFGIIEFGRIFNADLIITNASREGVRQGAVGANDATIVQDIKNSVTILDPTQLTITISPPDTNRRRGDELKIHIEYPVKIYTPIISNITGDPYVVKADTVMRVE